MHVNLWVVDKFLLRAKCIVLKSHIRQKKKRLIINDLSIHLKMIEKQSHQTQKRIMKEVIEIRAEINERESVKMNA